MANTNTTSFLGTGWAFPPSFNPISRSAAMLSNEDDIRSSLEILLGTRLGERVMQPTYGCNLDEMLFEPINTSFKTYITDMVKTAILYHEPRITLDKLDLSNSNELEGLILMEIDYTVRATNSRLNYVYPFYKNEGTEIK